MSKGRQSASVWRFRSIVHLSLSATSSFVVKNRIPIRVGLTLRFTAFEMEALRERRGEGEGKSKS